MSGPITHGFKRQDEMFSYNDIAARLINDKLLLTALELHMELLDSGKEIKILKDFFSNPSNFEFPSQEISSRISRSESQVTLDSLDLTRFSEDGATSDEKVAVLEFELRKAKETISALRNNLTMATESENSTPSKGCVRELSMDTIKPHEQRALNFLINEYLLLNSYKLTSITFADENQHQDFDDWDDVGLNIAKPPELLSLYRESFKQGNHNNYLSASTQTELESYNLENLQDKINAKEEELRQLEVKYKHLESECFYVRNTNSTPYKEHQEELCLNQMETLIKNTSNNKNSPGSESPSERFEIVDKHGTLNKKRDSVANSVDNISTNSLNVNDWTNLVMTVEDNAHYENNTDKEETNSERELNCSVYNINIREDIFRRQIFALCYVNIPRKVDNEILDDVLNYPTDNSNLIHTLSSSLLKIIPNIILNKREDSIPLLMTAIRLNPDVNERDRLLQQLFNLKKKPSDIERIMILTGLVGIAKFAGQTFVENEILPQCWEQLTDKHIEKRLLVTEACIALVPYVSSQIRNSLILSMLQQLLGDREEIVREAVIRALCLVMVLCEDYDKYLQCEELAVNILNDPNQNILSITNQILFPVLGRWALSLGALKSHLLKRLLHILNDYSKDSEANKVSNKISNIIDVLDTLTPFLLMSVVTHDDILKNIGKDMTIEIRSNIMQLCSTLTNPCNFYKSDYNVGMILYEFDKYIADNPTASWPEMTWLLDVMVPDLLNSLNHIELNHQTLIQRFIKFFSNVCICFGENFTKLKLKQVFESQINNLEEILSNFNQCSLSLNVIPVYLVSVLSFCDIEELSVMLKKFLSVLPLFGTPLDCLEITIKGLCERGLQKVAVICLWEGVVHQRPLVRAVAATLFSLVIGHCDKDLLNLKVTPALVTLASDSDVLVRTAAVPALGSLITNCSDKEIHDKAYMQIQNYTSDVSLKENHSLLRQLIVTLGAVVNTCSVHFRQEVILPQLSTFTTYTFQMANQTRKIDLVQALIEAYTSVVYSPHTKQDVNLVTPGLRCLEVMVTENHALISHQETVLSLLRECDDLVNDSDHGNKLGQNINQGVEEMKQRVSKIFTKPSTTSKPNTLPNLHNIFKKK